MQSWTRSATAAAGVNVLSDMVFLAHDLSEQDDENDDTTEWP